jgi:hypothetical protein
MWHPVNSISNEMKELGGLGLDKILGKPIFLEIMPMKKVIE